MPRHTHLILAAGLAGALLATTVRAATPPAPPAQHVRFDRRELETAAGVQRLYARLRRAAEAVCGQADIRNLESVALQRDCVRRALDRAVEDIHSERLLARHRGGGVAPRLARLDGTP